MSRATELYFESHKSISQFAYFQLGVAASAIAFAVHETDGRSLYSTPWPIGAAVALWALSFFLGSLGVNARIRSINLNAAFLIAKEKFPPEWRGELERLPEHSEFERDIELSANRPTPLFRWQLRFLFFGALAYIAGHLMDMAAMPPS